LDHQFKAEMVAFRVKIIGSWTETQEGAKKVPQKHWFAQGFAKATCGIAMQRFVANPCGILMVSQLTSSVVHGIYRKRYLFCFKTMVQMVTRPKCCNLPLRTINKPLGLSMKRGVALLRVAFANPYANQLFWGYFWVLFLRICPTANNFDTKRYYFCFKQ